jgi:hypothetical protein
MNTRTHFVSAMALAAACTLVNAQEVGEYTPEELAAGASSAVQVDGGAQRIEITAPGSAVRAARAALMALDQDTVYVMADGRKLTVSPAGDVLRVRLGRNRAVTVAHDGAGNFVSRDGVVSLRFEPDARNDAGTVHATIPAAWL